MIGLMQAVKSFEKLTVEAAITGSFQKAIEALLVHPLVGDYHRARAALEEMLMANRDFLPQFGEYFKKKEE
jgi:6-phospho-beta-glucosidase